MTNQGEGSSQTPSGGGDTSSGTQVSEGGIDHAPQIENYKKERDEWKSKLAEAEAREKAMQEKLSFALSTEDVTKAVKEAKDAAAKEAKTQSDAWAAKEKAMAVTNKLLSSGCIDEVSALAHVDMSKVEIASDGHISGLDVEALKKDRPHLFSGAQTFSTGAALGSSGKKMTRSEIMAIKDTRKRQEAIASNMHLFE